MLRDVAMSRISWKHYGPERKASGVDAPPKPSLIDGYALDYDEALEKIVYVALPDCGVQASLHGFDGQTWSMLSEKTFERPGGSLGLAGGGYDSLRQGI